MTYEYLCTSCENVWEAQQSISEAPLTTCPRCGKPTAKRQVSGGAGFILKGGGWYADLYGSAPKKPAEASTESAASGSSEAKKTGDAKKADAPSGDAGSVKKDTSKGSGGSDGGSKGPSGSGPKAGSGPKGGADSSAA